MVPLLTNDDFPLRKRRATDYHWSKNIFPIVRRIREPGQPILYYIEGRKHGFTRSQLLSTKFSTNSIHYNDNKI